MEYAIILHEPAWVAMNMTIKNKNNPENCFFRTMSFNELPVGRILANRCGFTLVEMVVVCSILLILYVIAINFIGDFKKKTRNARAAAEIRGIEKDINDFAIDKGYLPSNLATIKRDILDPWGHPYVYQLYAAGSMREDVGRFNLDYDLYSKGFDGLTAQLLSDTDSKDDILRFNDGGYVGVAEFY